jgi:hypothetical protein
VRLVLSRFRSFGLPALRRIRVPAEGNPRRRGGEADLQSGFAENPGDLANGNPIDLGDLAERHTVFYQGADARKLGLRNLARDRAPSYSAAADRDLRPRRVAAGAITSGAGVDPTASRGLPRPLCFAMVERRSE